MGTRPTQKIKAAWVLLFVGLLLTGPCAVLRAASLSICSFNIKFLGNSPVRDDVGLADLLKDRDIVVVQELVSPPYAGAFPDGAPYVPNPKARRFFDCMSRHGFSHWLSEEDTGPGLRLHLNTSATEWWVVFFKTNTVRQAPDLPSGFLAADRARNRDFDRVPYAFGFRSVDGAADFVLVSVHLEPGVGRLNRARRKHELAAVAAWIRSRSGSEKDFLVLGDMNIENQAELVDAVPPSFASLNDECRPTNTNGNSPKPYDHVLYFPTHSGPELERNSGLEVVDLVGAMRPRWTGGGKYPGGPPYRHNEFIRRYSDHDPVAFVLYAATDDD